MCHSIVSAKVSAVNLSHSKGNNQANGIWYLKICRLLLNDSAA